jgi:transcriptional regulator with XRE-family HTH domain
MANLQRSTMTTKEFRKALADLGWSQAETARRCGMTRITINRYANGTPIPELMAAYIRAVLALKEEAT